MALDTLAVMSTRGEIAMRPATLGDVDAITGLVAAAELAANGVVDIDCEDVLAELELPSVERGKHAVVVEAGGTTGGWAGLETQRGAVHADARPHPRPRWNGSHNPARPKSTAPSAPPPPPPP